MKITRPIITFDTETTGVNTSEDRVVQIAAIKRYSDGKIEEKNYLINPERGIPEEATLVHGITNEMVAKAPTFKQMASAMREWFKGSDISGFNTDSFDCNIMLSEMERCGLSFLDWNCNFVDVMKLYRHFYPNTQEAIYERFFGEKLENAHDALADCRASDKILDKILKDNFEEEVSPEQIDLLLQGEKIRVDFEGKLYKDQEGVVRYNFGKDKDKSVKENKGFGQWMLNQTFSKDTKTKLKQILNEQ